MTGSDSPTGAIDVATLEVLGRRATSHPLVTGWAFEPDGVSPRRVALALDPAQYPSSIEAARIDVRWYQGGDYTFHYVESRGDGDWQCRWDRHPKPDAPRSHFHPPPDAGSDVDPSGIEATHPLGVLFAVMDWTGDRVGALHDA